MEKVLQQALDTLQKGQSCAFATVIETSAKGAPRKAGAKMVVTEDGSIFGTIGGGYSEKDAQKQCLKAIKTKKSAVINYDHFGEKSHSVCGGQVKVFIEPFIRKKNLIICGAGHIALPLSLLGKMLQFEVTIIDNRKDYANKKRFPHVDHIIIGNHAKKLKEIAIDQNTFIMIVTHGHEHDYNCLKTAIGHNFGYLGVISSKAKKAKFFNSLKKEGITQNIFKNVSIPAGLDIGAQTPAEIALSIASEIITINNKTFMGTEKFKKKYFRKAVK